MSKRELPQVIVDLQAIRDRLTNPEAWSKGLFGSEEGPNCLIGAVDVVIGVPTLKKWQEGCVEAQERRWPIREAIVANIPAKYDSSVVGYNDAPETTHKDILDLLDLVIKSEKKIAGVVEFV